MIDAVLHALAMAGAMAWEILWPLILGFALSAVVQAVVSHKEMSRVLPDDRPRSIATAVALGAASSSCSYAAVAVARSLFRKGANFTAAMTFELASTNLVAELSIILIVLMGWKFMLSETIGALVMVAFLVVLFRLFLTPHMVAEAKEHADTGIPGRMEGHAEMDMSVTEGGSLWQRITSPQGLTAISHYFVMDWASVWADIAGGLLIAGALAAWVPHQFWQSFFLVNHPVLATIWGPLVGPLVAVLAFVCSVGNIPLAAVLWNGGISFGGVIAFIFLRGHGRCGFRRRGGFRGRRVDPVRAQRPSGRSADSLELHNVAEHHLPMRRGCVGVAIPEDRGADDAAHDERSGSSRTCS